MSQTNYATHALNATKENEGSQEGNVIHTSNATNQNNVHLNNATQTSDDKRLPPKYRKNQELWQYYLLWQELIEMRKRHNLRIASISAGKSNMNPDIEQWVIDDFDLDRHLQSRAKSNPGIFMLMVKAGEAVGPIWDWMIAHKGIGESLAAQILALINDISQFDSIAKLWRYSGYGIYEYWVDENGKVQCPKEGWKWHEIGKDKKRYRVWTVVNNQCLHATQESNVNNKNGSDHSGNVTHFANVIYAIPQNIDNPILEHVDYLQPEPNWTLKKMSDRKIKGSGYHSPYNWRLKTALWNLSECFIKQQTPYYVDLYYAEKKRLRALHPEKKKVNGKWKWNDGHINNMAKRKMRKEFLKQLWLKWRKFEGLPLSEEY